jgi:hypothetical protein
MKAKGNLECFAYTFQNEQQIHFHENKSAKKFSSENL